MKRVALFLSLSVIVSCSLTDNYSLDTQKSIDLSPLIITKGTQDFFQRDFSVSMEDVNMYLRFNSPKDKEVLSITPITLYNDKVQGYLVSFNEGWSLISADKRTKIILAESTKGLFSLDNTEDPNEGRRTLIMSFLSEVHTIQNLSSETDVEKVLGKEALSEMENNVLLWDLLTEPTQVLEGPETKYNEPNWVYVLDTIIYDTVTVEFVDHLTETRWTQHSPYNQYFPYTNTYYTTHVPNGCVPLAGAQMLYFLHNELGVPQYAPTNASVSGTYYNYTWDQTGNSSTIWNSMNSSDGASAAVFIAKIAKTIGVTFVQTNGVFYTGASTESLIDVFDDYGIGISYYTYNQDSVKFYIMERGMPVIADADNSSNNNISGHSFIIDAGLKGQRRAAFYYKKVYLDGTYGIGYHEYLYLNDYIWKFGINWGMGPEYDYEWYQPTGSWTINGDSFDYNRHIILGYRIN